MSDFSVYDEVDPEAFMDWREAVDSMDDDDRAYNAQCEMEEYWLSLADEFAAGEWVPESHVPGQMTVFDYLANHPLINEVTEEDIPF